MPDIMTAAVSALQSKVYDQIAVSLLKSSAHAQQAVADMLMQNAQRGQNCRNRLQLLHQEGLISTHREIFWWTVRDSNPRLPRCERGALPAELTAHSAS